MFSRKIDENDFFGFSQNKIINIKCIHIALAHMLIIQIEPYMNIMDTFQYSAQQQY